ncbi:unnamed protein product [Auanema sp. JU1783]|nr:unnamed protein product [Auanema sp. JU1783]
MNLRGFFVFVLIAVVQSKNILKYHDCDWIVPLPCGLHVLECKNRPKGEGYQTVGYPVMEQKEGVILASETKNVS